MAVHHVVGDRAGRLAEGGEVPQQGVPPEPITSKSSTEVSSASATICSMA
jgi:hypothetical protein